jgi:lipoate-protein ligase A
MRLLDLTFAEPELNLALDEALLEEAEGADWQTSRCVGPSLRFWEPEQPLVVVGRSSPLGEEVNLEFCQRQEIPILRRCSGGATIVTGPGCLMYAVLIGYQGQEELRSLDNAHRYVMERMVGAISRLGIPVDWRGTCDLTLGGRKVSGNSLRCRRQGFLYHGTMLCRSFELSLVGQALHLPRRQPEYRQGRSHAEFVTRLPCEIEPLKQAIQQAWGADEVIKDWPRSRTRELARDKYSSPQWNRQIV